MKFNPKLESFIFALNLQSRIAELRVIMEFSSVQPIELRGYWKGVPERAYQIDARLVDVDAMLAALSRYGQEACLYIGKTENVYQINANAPDELLGTMVQIPHQIAECTYCITTETYWKAITNELRRTRNYRT